MAKSFEERFLEKAKQRFPKVFLNTYNFYLENFYFCFPKVSAKIIQEIQSEQETANGREADNKDKIL
jgi:hypothetical protein